MLGEGHQGKEEGLKESQLQTITTLGTDLTIKVASLYSTYDKRLSYTPTQLTDVDNKTPQPPQL